MDIRINAIHFDISDRLVDFINKKVERLGRHFVDVTATAVNLKVLKPESAMNKEASVIVTLPGHDDFVASKVANSFEEAIDLSLEALERQLEKTKGKK